MSQKSKAVLKVVFTAQLLILSLHCLPLPHFYQFVFLLLFLFCKYKHTPLFLFPSLS